MQQVIIYNQDDGSLAVIHPSPEALAKYGIREIALKDVPAGKPFKIIPVSDLPQDREFRAAWEVPNSSLIDGVGAEYNSFQE